eukprot:s1230_g25.t1
MFAEAMLVSLDFVTNSENTVQRKGSWLISAGSAGHGSCIQVLRGTRTSSRHAFRGSENTVQRKGSWLISAGSAGHGSCIQVLRGTRTSSRHAFRGATQEFCVVFCEEGPMHPGFRAALAAVDPGVGARPAADLPTPGLFMCFSTQQRVQSTCVLSRCRHKPI